MFKKIASQGAKSSKRATSAYFKYTAGFAALSAFLKMFIAPVYADFQRDGTVTVPLVNQTVNVKRLLKGDFDGALSGTGGLKIPGNPLGGLFGGNGSGSGGATPQGKEALSVLNALSVKGKAAKTGYSRAQFGPAWTDSAKNVALAGNGCDTRNDILKRDLKNVKIDKNKCTVLTGVLSDPYTGKSINFERGPKSAAVQVDHLVALGNAWITGAQQLSAEQRKSLANDPLNLLAVDGPTNGAKSDSDAATWLPPNRKSWCGYAAAQVNVKHKYRLWVTPAEKNALARILSGC